MYMLKKQEIYNQFDNLQSKSESKIIPVVKNNFNGLGWEFAGEFLDKLILENKIDIAGTSMVLFSTLTAR